MKRFVDPRTPWQVTTQMLLAGLGQREKWEETFSAVRSIYHVKKGVDIKRLTISLKFAICVCQTVNCKNASVTDTL